MITERGWFACWLVACCVVIKSHSRVAPAHGLVLLIARLRLRFRRFLDLWLNRAGVFRLKHAIQAKHGFVVSLLTTRSDG